MPEHLDSLVAGPSPTAFTTYRRDNSAVASPVWFRFRQDSFEVVVAEDDVKLRPLPRTALVRP